MQQSFAAKNRNTNSTIKAFLNNFISDDFFVNLINICLYPSEFSSTTTMQNNSVVEYVNKFLDDLIKTTKQVKIQNFNQLQGYVNLSHTILNIRENGTTIISYNNVHQHVPGIDLSQQQLLQRVMKNKLTSTDEFRRLTNRVMNDIQTFYEVHAISDGITKFESFVDYASSNSVSAYEATKMYKDNVIQIYNDLSKLHSLNKQENEKDYFCISDKESTKELSDSLVEYLSKEYSFYTSGYDIIDKYVEGFESASLHLISAPSNHGKSIFMANIARTMIEENINSFEPEDAVLLITLEDDIRKLTRRLCSIFGNYDAKSLKNLYSTAFDITRANQMISSSNQIDTNLRKTMNDVIETSIYGKTQGKVQLIVKHCNENEFSAGDLNKFIDLLRVEGKNVKMIILDYIDVMNPTAKTGSEDPYVKQGWIVHELRNLAKNQKLPILTATQNSRGSENLQYGMNNQQIGDSYLKVRYTDFLYMCRMNTLVDPFDDSVKKHVFNSENYTDNGNKFAPYILKMKDKISENLIPFEVKITKSKDDGRDQTKFLLFCKQNLRVYNTIDEYLDDMEELGKRTKDLNNKITELTNIAFSSISDDFDNIIDGDSYSNVIPFV
ncbi:MAG: DnaB-like helicase C-terminal domain-containing protein [bacterium]